MGADLQQRALGVEHVEEPELAGFKAGDRGVEHALRGWQDVFPHAAHLLARQLGALVRVGKPLVQAQAFGLQFGACLLGATERGLQAALVAVE